MVMTQLSRPYQIALLTMALFVAVWFLALRGHATTTPEPGSSASVPATAATPAPAVPATTTPAPSHAVTAAAAAAAKHAAAVKHAAGVKRTAEARHASAVHHAAAGGGAAARPAPAIKKHPAAAVSPQLSVEAELRQGKIVAILFWNPRGTVDGAVSRELNAAARSLHGKLVVHQTGSGEVSAFGSITRDVQVDQTPTILIIEKGGRTQVLTGLTDSYSIAQAIEELGR